MELTKAQLQALAVSVNAALAQVAKEHGLEVLRWNSCTYDKAGTFTVRVEGRLAGAPTKEQQRYDLERVWMKLPARGAEFAEGSKVHKLWGMNSTATKIITECSDGKKYNWPVASVRRFFPEQKAAG